MIVYLSRVFNIDLMTYAFKENGIWYWPTYRESGELFLLQKIASEFSKIKNNDKKLVFFDVGANVGTYSKMLVKQFPQSVIYCFEPNPHSFSELSKTCTGTQFILNNNGLSDKEGIVKLHRDHATSGLTTMYKEVYEPLYHIHKTEEVSVQMITLDTFCKKNNIGKIDLIKIDTEGHGLAVLRGAQELISHGKIGIIQFEFNQNDIFSKTFLRDYYVLLKDYHFFRLKEDALISLEPYSPMFEIHYTQNIVAIQKNSFNLLLKELTAHRGK